jgi:hypothetical protein
MSLDMSVIPNGLECSTDWLLMDRPCAMSDNHSIDRPFAMASRSKDLHWCGSTSKRRWPTGCCVNFYFPYFRSQALNKRVIVNIPALHKSDVENQQLRSCARKISRGLYLVEEPSLSHSESMYHSSVYTWSEALIKRLNSLVDKLEYPDGGITSRI